MSRTLFARNLIFGILTLALLAFLTAVPAFAQGNQSGGQFCFGNNIVVTATQNIESLLAFGCNVSVEPGATIRGDLVDFGGNATIAGTVGGNVAMIGGNVSLAETAVINGKLSMVGGNVQQAPGAQVNGGVERHTGRGTPAVPPAAPLAPTITTRGLSMFDFHFDPIGGIITALAFAALGALVVIFAPNATKRIGTTVESKPLNAAGMGCLTFIVVPTLAILLVFTLIGIPVSGILIFGLGIASLFGWIAIGYLTGEKVLLAINRRDILPVVAVVVGILILGLLTAIPVLGFLIWLIVATLGLGAVVLTRFGTRAYPAVPTMMMTPAVAAAGPSVPGTYAPTQTDLAAWEEKARQVQAQQNTPPPTAPPTGSAGSEPKSEPPPEDSIPGA